MANVIFAENWLVEQAGKDGVTFRFKKGDIVDGATVVGDWVRIPTDHGIVEVPLRVVFVSQEGAKRSSNRVV